ncbi:hypothetical protein HMN09_00373200 [Mycena chlorophos]|uniref:Uncharacterized protein n=1 Tax=Mycena chlorophos TaxID=658473 RepID=A0A8H6TGT8_MYCCL|nr:hypothetical protein HMN09_00373200 [Mycena chlorophos]
MARHNTASNSQNQSQGRKSSRKATAASRSKFTTKPPPSSSCAIHRSRFPRLIYPHSKCGSRCQLPLHKRAKARLLHRECHLCYGDIAKVLQSSDSVVRGAVRNKYKPVPDDESQDWRYISDDFRKMYLVDRDPTPPPVEPTSSQCEREAATQLLERARSVTLPPNPQIKPELVETEDADADMDNAWH